jgi:phosphopentomutase
MVHKHEFKRVFLAVMDGAGAGEAPDAAAFGDAGSSTLCHIAQSAKLHIPNLLGLGLGCIEGLGECFPPASKPLASYGRMNEASPAKDTTTGHWEMMGVIRAHSGQVFPHGFPPAVIDELERRSGRGLIGNEVASGTEIIQRLGAEHLLTGSLIVYTSADSVMQIAAHETIVPPPVLYRVCRVARELMQGGWEVDRIIARPFKGDEKSGFVRTLNRRDFSIPPPSNFLDTLRSAGVEVTVVGKLDDIFAGRGFSRSLHTGSSADTAAALQNEMGRSQGFWFINFIDFDQLYGHRNDVQGFAHALDEFDEWLGGFLPQMQPPDLLLITADHGNDPTTPSTDHSREYVPLLAYAPAFPRGVALGTRSTFADAGAAVLEAFKLVKPDGLAGEGFCGNITGIPMTR